MLGTKRTPRTAARTTTEQGPAGAAAPRSRWRIRRAARAPRPQPGGCRCRHPHGELPPAAGGEVRVDVRGLPMAGQIGRTLALMEELPAGARLRHVNSLVPWELFAMLETRGYRYRLVGRGEGEVQVLVWSLADEAASVAGDRAAA